ncbi:uncharacterized protein LOC106637834 [Copidosoma floridanum]|uniref:uncharacterized protein LOC106637834 n=1 Tax=Copidosoma floridanum TaxID=29053 RepID=UPI0006C95ADA|nr:uncharacterized protein LOC106637834 [Copidosoma floridanum]
MNYECVNGEEITFVRLFAKFNFGWTQRANGYAYDSLNGYGALIGELSGMVLVYITFNRKCRQCDSNEKRNVLIEHDCRLNFYGSAKGMEAEGARKLVTENELFKNAHVEIGVFIAGNDSCSISAIQSKSRCTAREGKENYVGLQLKNAVLFKELKILFVKLAENAKKFLMAASSQANESLNNLMCSKAPKRLCYSTSQSCDLRFACTVVQKIFVEAYVDRILHALRFEMTDRLTRRIQRCDKKASKRKIRKERVNVKRRRIQLSQARSQLKHRQEKREGVSYSSHMSLFDVQESSSAQSFDADESFSESIPTEGLNQLRDTNSFETDEEAVVFFDLETGGFDMFKDEILQISLKCNEKSFTSYITPTRSINLKYLEIYNLTRINKNLYKNGQQVETNSKSAIAHDVLQFLKEIEKKCILVAHKCDFDSRRFVNLVKNCDLLSNFQNVIVGLTDTLPLFEKQIVDVENYKLTTLASSKLQICCLDAHDAKFDVEILEKLA